VYRRLSLRLLCLLLTLALPASAQFTRDNAANKKIDEAINEHYLATDFEKAEGVLTATVQACGDKCSPQVIARAWMYVGIVRGSGKNDQAGAKEAFQKAIASDPQVKLDAALATPETQKTFDNSGGTGGAAPPPEAPPEVAPAAGGDEEGPGGMKCTPDASEIETRRPIPVECVSDQDAASVELRYKPFGGEWKTLKMSKKGESFRVEIPCNETKTAGDLKVYARAKDAAGETIDNWGSKNKPINYTLGESVSGEPPAYAGETAPARCADSAECPPDFPGCGGGGSRGDVDWGGKCENSTECKQGLLCEGGVCENAPSCETNDDCSTGLCTEGKCDVGSDVASSAGPYKKNWLGIEYGIDFAMIGGSDVCLSGEYSCYETGKTSLQDAYPGPAYPGTGIAKGFAPATHRILLSYDRGFSPNFTAGVRVGYALFGGPPAVTAFDMTTNEPTASTSFLPFHAELRLTYWFGQGALAKKGVRPYAFVAGGMAQVDAKVKVKIYDCSSSAGMSAPTGCEGNGGAIPSREVDAWKKLGQGFAAIGGGMVYAVQPNLGIKANVNFMYMLGASGLVLEPSLGLVYGL